eukprot:gnl/MRDRNA2_/MRDRNA2_268263_c0_seq1.p1 gnl/MRDRNA2_/MRDRNA2_268263_c0~~gnl/MRDRNA2_/MRDRNA2_268263_c0_seq1.p1  ORF type:complete len:102 (-),score=14.19 gnl/MRDRNA2_/MRDRNA2_268263_c0_seq1:20-325(-)
MGLMYMERIWPDTMSYNAAIRAYGKAKCWELSMEMVVECKAHSTADVVTHQAAIGACEKCVYHQGVVALLNDMGKARAVLEPTSYTGAVSSCESSKKSLQL